jgi:hypothetical protein
MALLSLKPDELFTLLVPELVVVVNFPNESDFVQNFLSIKSKFVIDMISPLLVNPQT